MSKRPIYFATAVATLVLLGGCALQVHEPGAGLGLLTVGGLIAALTIGAVRSQGLTS